MKLLVVVNLFYEVVYFHVFPYLVIIFIYMNRARD